MQHLWRRKSARRRSAQSTEDLHGNETRVDSICCQSVDKVVSTVGKKSGLRFIEVHVSSVRCKASSGAEKIEDQQRGNYDVHSGRKTEAEAHSDL